MTNEITYQELRQHLGEPLVEKHLTGGLGVRSDCWPCGCLRIVRARVVEVLKG